MIKYIIFDVGEVLLAGVRDIGLALAEKFKLEGMEKTFANISPTPLLTPLIKEFFAGTVNEDTYLNEVIKTYPQLGNKEELKQLIRNNFTEVAGTREIVIKLKSLGYKLGLLSVHGREWIEYCEEKYDFHKLFDVVSFSYHEGNLKPDKQAFISVIKKFPASPEECLFIDDAIVNIQAAEELGIKGILFTTAEDLEQHLKSILPNYFL